MKVDQSKALNKGTRVYWQGDAADGGIITATSWRTPRGHARNSAKAETAASGVTAAEQQPLSRSIELPNVHHPSKIGDVNFIVPASAHRRSFR